MILSCLVSLPLSEPSLGMVETRSPVGMKIRLPKGGHGSVIKAPRLGRQYFLLSLASTNRGSKDAPNNLDPFNGTDTSLHFHLESACQFLNHSRCLSMTVEAMEHAPNLAELSVASVVNSAAATTLLNS